MSVVLLVCTRGLAQQNDLKQIAVSLARDINAGNHHTITVADFTDLQGNVTELGRFISEELSTQLVLDAKSFTVVERLQLAAVLKEHRISVSGLVDPSTIRKLGQFAGVDAIVTGTLVPFSDSVRLTAKVLDVSTAKVMAVSTADLPRTKAIDDLLSRGISAIALSDPGSGTGATSTQGPAQVAAVQQNDYLFVIRNCVRRGDSILCSGSATNKSEKPRDLWIGEGEAVDSSGNSFRSDQVHIGHMTGGDRVQIWPELPLNFFVNFPGADPTAKVTLVLGYGGGGVPLGSKALFRNIPLTAK